MKVLVARLNHETNTFSPIPTALESFSPKYGKEALQDQIAGNTAMTAMLQFAQGISGATLLTPLTAMANPSGLVQRQAFDHLCESILDASDGVKLFLLDLHGAMVVEGYADGEGILLEKIRSRCPQAKIFVALDLHANVTEKMTSNVDAMVSFKTYPHVDMYETGEHLTRIADLYLKGKARPVTAFRQIPLLSHTLKSNTQEGAMQKAITLARQAEGKYGILAASINAGFSLADFDNAGMSVVVVADGNQALAQQVADEIADQIWKDRAGFVYQSESIDTSLRRAVKASSQDQSKPVLLLDHSDNVMSGGSCDTTDILDAALQKGLENILVGPLCDPLAVSAAYQAGLGAEMDFEIGNRHARPKGVAMVGPVTYRGRVLAFSDGVFEVRGPIYQGSTMRMGRTALIDLGKARVVLTENRVEPFDLGIFETVGAQVRDARYLILKSRMYCRPVFGPLCSEMIECDSDKGGPTSSNYALFQFTNIRRPIYPLDPC